MTVEQALDALGSEDAAKREAAEALFAGQDPGLIPELLWMARGSHTDSGATRDCSLDGCSGCLGCLGLMGLTFIVGYPEALSEIENRVRLAIQLAIIGAVVARAALAPRRRRRREWREHLRRVRTERAIKILSEWTDLRALKPLSAPYGIPSYHSELLLARLLPGVTAESEHMLPRENRVRLYDSIRTDRSPPHQRLALELVRMAERLEDTSALKMVRVLADPASQQPVATKAIREAAQRALPKLEARARLEREGKTLLRPADSSTAGASLLRPSLGAEFTAPEVLLRPRSREEPDE